MKDYTSVSLKRNIEYKDLRRTKLLEQNLVTLEAALKAKEEETVFIWWWF
ncbi:hypothetical protein OAD20_01165 [Cyclobacteriaceae bacterium]|nr:hypothetical protein [Cyclobacteriaceae bacterium]MDB4606092.1 hypothetical protein [Cyclobacteriaceae bacterium]MDB4742573.1 hypothetical protein [Cyclobacteriaceae bacterium]MDB9939268.1 hypothetical protein [Cyclobacteriaceae bacterium]|tara:strand:- start:144 stop:293 length:150 start_codon:yes stop_codon:yes gene_type:complete